jgi:hypothetical protein
LHGSELARRRLEMILRTLSGELTVDEAFRERSIHASRFHLRSRWLQQSLELLEPRPTGRPSQDDPPANAAPLAAMEAEAVQRRAELEAAQSKLELGHVMPHLLRDQRVAAEAAKKEETAKDTALSLCAMAAEPARDDRRCRLRVRAQCAQRAEEQLVRQAAARCSSSSTLAIRTVISVAPPGPVKHLEHNLSAVRQ